MGVLHPPWILLLTLAGIVAGKFPHTPLNVNCSDLHQENATDVQLHSTNEYGESFCISAVFDSWVEAFGTWKFATEQDLFTIREQTTISKADAVEHDEVNINGEERTGREKLSAEEEGVGEEEEKDDGLSPEKSSFPVKIRVKGHRHWGFLHPDRDYEVVVKSVAAHPVSFLLALNAKENLSSCGVGGLHKTEIDVVAVQNDTSSENQSEVISDSLKKGSWVSPDSNFYWAYGEIHETDTVSLLFIPPECGCLIISGFVRFPSSNTSLIIRPEDAPEQLSKLMCVDSYSVPLKDEENSGSVTEKLESENKGISDNDKPTYRDSEPRQSNTTDCDMDILGEVMKTHRRPSKFKQHVIKRMKFRQKQRKKLRQKFRKEARKHPGRRRSHRMRSRHHRRQRKGRRRHHEREDTDKDKAAFANRTDETSSIEEEVPTDNSGEEDLNTTDEYGVTRDNRGKDEEEDEETAAFLRSISESGRETEELNKEIETATDETHKKRRKHKKRRDKKQRRKEKKKNKINTLAKKAMGPGVKMCCQQGVRLKKHCFHERNATGNYSDPTLCVNFPEEVGMWAMYSFHTPKDVCIFHFRRCCEHFSLQWWKNWKQRRQERKVKRKKWRQNKQEKIREIWKKQKQKWRENISHTEEED